VSASATWLKPRRLTRGDRVALVAPASAFNREEFDAGVGEIRALGFEPVYDDRVFARDRFVAGPASVRAAVLHDAWRDPTIAALIAVRGGYGSAQLLPLLDHEAMRGDARPSSGTATPRHC
jgi:muramoyltetrapeptide carboxypeptidase